MAKHVSLEISEGHFSYRILEEKVGEEARLDGLYVVRTSLSKEEMSGEDAVRSYKQLSHVELAFRSMKGIDLKVRPIYHHLDVSSAAERDVERRYSGYGARHHVCHRANA